MDLPTKVAKVRYNYHLLMVDVNNVLNQIGLRKNDRAEQIGKYHTMTIVKDILPRLGYDVDKMFQQD